MERSPLNGLLAGLHWLLWPYGFFRRHGPTFRARLPGLGSVLVTGEAKLLEQIARHPDLVGGRAHRALRAVLGTDHLIVLWGEAHRQRTRIVRHALNAFPPTDEIERVTREEFGAVTPRRPFSFHAVAHRASLRLMLLALFGNESPEVLEAARTFQRSFSQPLNLFVPWLQRDWGAWTPWGRLVRRRAALHELLLHQAATAAPDTVAGRLRERLHGDSLRDELLALLMFGHETTAATLCWAFVHWRQYGGEPGEALVLESMRMAPAVAQLTRVAERNTRVGNWPVARDSVVMPAISLAHRECPQPDEFRPDRPTPAGFCPFGFGERICPGKAIALRQIETMLRTMQSLDLQLLPGYRARPRRQLFLVVPEGGTPAIRP